MKIMIEIPEEFISDYEADRFEDCFQRFICDSKTGLMAGNYERETAEMLIKAFKDAKEVVSCKDCRHAVNEPDRDGSDVWICNYNHWRRAEGIRCPDGFCSDGERKEE